MSDIIDPQVQESRLRDRVEQILDEAKRQGASAAEVGVSLESGLSASVRMKEVETIEFHQDQGFGVTVYFGQRKGTASTSDSSEAAIKDTVKAACNIARFTAEDANAGLADAALMATDIPNLDLYHPWGLEPEQAIEMALECERAGLEMDSRIVNSEGAQLNTGRACRVYGNSHGFIGSYVSSQHSASCVLIGKEGEAMQRDYWYSVARDNQALDAMSAIGLKAGQRTVARLGARSLPTGKVPVLFAADIARGLISHFLGAITGSNLYRKSSFLLDQLGQPIFPEFVTIQELPYLRGGLGSAAFDNEGVATRENFFIRDGILENYVLNSYAARKLGMQTTANAGGVHNLTVSHGDLDQSGLLQQMQRGLLVTEVMGQGVNLVTGDYSRGAAGFWVENGEIQYPVEGITIAGNLRDIFQRIQAIGSDVDERGNIRTGSILVDEMTLAGT